jgi:hypothetical protein
MSIELVNVRGMPPNAPGITYLGRPCGGWKRSPLANRYRIGPDGNRQEVIAKYRRWLWGIVQERDSDAWTELQRLAAHEGPLTLGCWCLPAPCHIEVVKAAILWLREQVDLI